MPSDPISVPPYLYGDSADPLGDHVRADGQVLVSSAAEIPVGDAPDLLDHARGGNDTLTAESQGAATAFGDVNQTISDHARGGDDVVTVGATFEANAYGDAMTLSDHAMGGDDTVSAARFSRPWPSATPC